MSFILKNRWVMVIFLCAFVLRIYIALWSLQYRENTDIIRYRDWARISYTQSFADTYNPAFITFGTLPNNQPPGSVYILGGAFQLFMFFAKAYVGIVGGGVITDEMNSWLNGPVLSVFLRFPSIIADCIIGFLIYRIALRFTKKSYSLVTLSVYLFNPVVLYNSAFWGQTDSLVNVWFIVSLYLLLKKKILFSMVCFALSLYTKLSLLPIFPLFMLLWWIRIDGIRLKLVFHTVITTILLFILTLPISRNPLVWSINFITKNGAGEIQDITAFAFNGWWFIFHPFISFSYTGSLWEYSQITQLFSPSSMDRFIGMPFFYWGIIVFMLLMIPLYFLFLKNKCNDKKIIVMISLSLCALFIILPQMHERYLYPLFPILAILTGVKKKYLIIYIILSCMNFINIYAVWHPFYTPLIPPWFIGNRFIQWSISAISVITFVYWYVNELYRHEKSY